MQSPTESDAYVLHGKHDLRLENSRPLLSAGASHVIVEVDRVGICGSDLHYYEHGRCGAFAPDRPFVLGHEFAGRIASIGNQVKALAVGDRVAVMPLLYCGTCHHCLSGRTNICEDAKFFGSARVSATDGAYSKFVVAPAKNCHPIPDGLSFEMAALLEPLSVCMHATSRSGDLRYKNVLITGGGPIGQLLAMVARVGGAEKIALSDIRQSPRSFAESYSADVAWNPSDSNFLSSAKKFARGGFDIVIDASGAPPAITQAFDLVRRGGTIVQVGTLAQDPVIPWNQVMTKELQIFGSFGFPDVFDDAIRLANSGKLPLEKLVTRVVPFSELPAGIASASEEGSVKVQVAVNE